MSHPTRRSFFISAASIVAFPASLLGCGANQGTLAAILTAIGATLAITLNNAGLTEWATKIQMYAQVAANVIRSWVPGSPAQDVVQALNDFLSNISLIPVDSPVVLADVQDAIQTIQGLLSDFGVTMSGVQSAARTHAAIVVTAKYPSNAKLKAVLADYKSRHRSK